MEILTKVNAVLRRVSYYLENIVLYLCVLVFAAKSVLTIVAVFSRYVLGSAISFAEETTRYMMVFVSMFGVVLALRDDEHIGLELVVERLPRNIRQIVDILVNVLLLVFAVLLAYYGFVFASTTQTLGEILPISMKYPHYIVFFSAVLMVIVLVTKILTAIIEYSERGGSCL